jgi:hypothetical protein
LLAKNALAKVSLPISALYDLLSELSNIPNAVYVVFWMVEAKTIKVFKLRFFHMPFWIHTFVEYPHHKN